MGVQPTGKYIPPSVRKRMEAEAKGGWGDRKGEGGCVGDGGRDFGGDRCGSGGERGGGYSGSYGGSRGCGYGGGNRWGSGGGGSYSRGGGPRDKGRDSRRDYAEIEKLFSSAASREALPPRTFTVGSYNLLHPTYAQKYREREGIGRDGSSNWAARMPHIARLLSVSRLDVYLLQEVDQAQAAELVRVGGITDSYDLHHCTHPNREAQDGVAVLLRRECFSVAAREQIPFDAREEKYRGGHYMCAAATFARHLETGLRLVLVSVHLYPKKSIDPQATLLAFLERRAPDFDAAVWGGDCNHVYASPPAGFAWEPTQAHAPTRRGLHTGHRGKKIDWIFCSRNCSLAQCGAANVLADASRQAIPETGSPPSDHFAVAAAVTLLSDGAESDPAPCIRGVCDHQAGVCDGQASRSDRFDDLCDEWEGKALHRLSQHRCQKDFF